MRYFHIVWLSFSLLLCAQSIRAKTPSTVEIECSWPCSNPADVCTITPHYARCQPSQANQWILKGPKDSPTYEGTLSNVAGEVCQKAPIPNLQTPSTNKNTTLILWPPIGINSLSTCGPNLYCATIDDQSSCQHRLKSHSTCTLSNECDSGLCENQICQVVLGQFKEAYTENHKPASIVVHVLAAVFGFLGAVISAAVVFVIYRRKRNRKRQTEQNDSENAPMPTPVMTRFDKFATDFCHEPQQSKEPSETSQSIQDQLRLLQHTSVPTLGSSSSSPPPYRP
ncbi:hypothetical protein J3Q64DRAFT_1110538 [Phycomyces blakesleeanus]